MPNPNQKILIVGGGIAGLAAAISLGKSGHDCHVVEIKGGEYGASIGITNRAVHALDALGVYEACADKATVAKPGQSLFSGMKDSAGVLLPIPPMPPLPDTGMPNFIAIYRPELAEILATAAKAAGAKIEIGKTITALVNGPDEVSVTFSTGDQASYDLVIGADGCRSSVRDMAFGDIVKPLYSGHIALRWMVTGDLEGEPGFYNQRDGNMVAVARLPGDRWYVAAGVDVPELRHIPNEEAVTILQGILDSYTAPILVNMRKHLDANQEVITRPFESLMMPAAWHKQRVVLIGDAAHSTTAHLSSGGGMALEDAVVLAEELAKASSIDSALESFTARRDPRARLVVETSVKLLELQQAKAGPAAAGPLRGRAIGVLTQPY